MPSSRLVLSALLSQLLLWTACLQTNRATLTHGMPPGKVRIVEERPGRGAQVIPGDRIRVHLVGRYASGEVWGRGPLTLLLRKESYPGLRHTLRVGATIRLEQLATPFDTAVRLEPFVGEDSENEAYQVRRDRGQILIEHHIRRVCRPMKLFMCTGKRPDRRNTAWQRLYGSSSQE